MRGIILAALLDRCGLQDRVRPLTIGDVRLPEFARPTIDAIIAKAHALHVELASHYGYGYEIEAKGHEDARRAWISLCEEHYGFSQHPGLTPHLIENTCITNGGMHALRDIADTIVFDALSNGKWPRFINPDNSFSTWLHIVDVARCGGRGGEAHIVPTEQKDLLHLTPEKVEEFYRTHPRRLDREMGFQDVWCMSPAGNPSGTLMLPNQLTETCRAIIRHNPDAVIILDVVYIRTLLPERARELMHGVLSDPEILQRIIFVKSASKTHGICGERIGAYFSVNDRLYRTILKQTMALFAGQGLYKSALAIALGQATPEQKGVMERLHRFCAAERHGLASYLRNAKFAHLFDNDQSHLCEEQLRDPMGLYVCMKLRPGVTVRDVALDTGCLGVEVALESGRYIRFSVGTLTEPTYGKQGTITG